MYSIFWWGKKSNHVPVVLSDYWMTINKKYIKDTTDNSRCFLAVIYLFSPNDRKTHDLTLTFGNESLNFSSILQVGKTKENKAVCSIKSNFPNKKYTHPLQHHPLTLKKNPQKSSNDRIIYWLCCIINVWTSSLRARLNCCRSLRIFSLRWMLLMRFSAPTVSLVQAGLTLKSLKSWKME